MLHTREAATCVEVQNSLFGLCDLCWLCFEHFASDMFGKSRDECMKLVSVVQGTNAGREVLEFRDVLVKLLTFFGKGSEGHFHV